MSLAKQALRRELLAQRAALPPERKQTNDHALCGALREILQRYSLVLAFYPVGDEPNILPALKRCRGEIYLPTCDTKNFQMQFYLVEHWDTLQPGAYGIPQAPGTQALQLPNPGALCLTPGLAFDCRGHRLGYGKGYYDRYFQQHKLPRLGICYEAFLRQRLPCGPQDLPVDWVLTEQRMLRCGNTRIRSGSGEEP
jgi:5-formyltetrahydrofolate cyclo-ligase